MSKTIWPSGDYITLLLVDVNLQAFQQRHPWLLDQGRDDLDDFEALYLPESDFGPLVLIKHANHPYAAAEIYIDRSHEKNQAAEDYVINQFLSNEKVIWTQSQGFIP